MRLHYKLERNDDRPLVAAIGFFDGMHRGHQEIARAALRMRRPGWRAAAITFANHPAAFLRPGTEPPLICTPEERVDRIALAGFDECFFVPFDASVASQEAEPFLRETLIGKLGVRGVVVGKTFRFGHKRLGDTALMARVFEEAGVAFSPLENTLDDGGQRVSSTRIRAAIADGNMLLADEMLGRSYELRGRVEMGEGRGHGLGFPTANIAVPDKLLPKDGVYAAVARYDGRDYAALVSIGTNPTFDGRRRTIEAWLRDFRETIYGEELALRELRFVREQVRFDGVEDLMRTMNEDLKAVAYPSYG
ncbi:MAG TPA: riboflavin biosynthesis protein RibF [Candidatus Baltobacteraceae bacterium]|nr:riboflavin biosynthesis protein RibF [Candidatus Baltobacteraceae bacterium]